jgi:hypothetical protein
MLGWHGDDVVDTNARLWTPCRLLYDESTPVDIFSMTTENSRIFHLS